MRGSKSDCRSVSRAADSARRPRRRRPSRRRSHPSRFRQVCAGLGLCAAVARTLDDYVALAVAAARRPAALRRMRRRLRAAARRAARPGPGGEAAAARTPGRAAGGPSPDSDDSDAGLGPASPADSEYGRGASGRRVTVFDVPGWVRAYEAGLRLALETRLLAAGDSESELGADSDEGATAAGEGRRSSRARKRRRASRAAGGRVRDKRYHVIVNV
jgi:hypothetical protein